MKTLLLPLALLAAACASTPDPVEVTPYPLNTCLVMDSELGSMGDPIVRVHDGQEVKFCCQPCVDEFESDPDFYLERLAEEVAPADD